MENQPLSYCLYARKSSEQDERQAMSIDSQVKEMLALAAREKLTINEVRQESHSAKESGQRPVFVKLLQDIRAGQFNAILTWAPDRLSRNAGDLGSLVDLMDQNRLLVIRTHSHSFSNNPNEKFLLMILCSQAKLENDNRGINVKRGIRTKCEMGWRPCMPPLGYYNRAMAIPGLRDTVIDPDRAPFIKKMFEMSAAGKSGRHIKAWLDSHGARTRTGQLIALSKVYHILKSPFYYGEFEYPKGSGKWYQGKHEPIVTKELFEEVQKQLIVPQKPKWGAKEFAFKRFLKCGSCGSSIVGESKTKTLWNGNQITHTYYHCSRQVDYRCKEPYVREEVIAHELAKACKGAVIDCTAWEPGLILALEQYKRIIGNKNVTTYRYIKYVLLNGSDFERTRLVRNLNLELILLNGTLSYSDPADCVPL